MHFSFYPTSQSAIEAVSSAEAEAEEEGEEEADALRLSKQRRQRRLSIPAHRFGVSSLFKQILREEGGRESDGVPPI